MSIRHNGKVIAGATQYHPDLFDWKWADHQLDDVQWLRADTFSWQDGGVYEAAYNHLAEDISGKSLSSETIAGITVQFYLADDKHKICPASEESNVTAIYNATGVAWYYILDTVNQRFKLPRTKFGFTGIRSGVGNYVEAGLPNLTGDAYSNGNDFVGTTTTGVFSGTTHRNGYGIGTTNVPYGNFANPLNFNASLSNSIYGNSDTVQPKATEMYLYFYVGNFTQTALENTAGITTEILNDKLDLDFNNITSTGKETVVGWGMPDVESGIEIPFNSSMDYAAPCDGFIHFKGNTIAADLYSPSGVDLKDEYWISVNYSANMTPIPKGFRCKYRSGSSQYSSVVFYPAKGGNNA